MRPDDINFAAFKYAEAAKEKFVAVCNPLFSLPVKMFSYFRFFNDGRYFYLCNRFDWLSFCLQNLRSIEGTVVRTEIGYTSEGRYHCFLWPTRRSDFLLSAVYSFDIWNGVSICKQREDGSVEIWGFAADRQAENMQGFYVAHLELFKDFVTFFNTKAAEIIAPTPHNLAVYKDFKKLPTFTDKYDMQKIQEFIEATPIHNRPLIMGDKEVFLSEREAQCLNFLAAGQTAKKIALNLKVALRTVEKHLENVRNKIGRNNKEGLIKTYQASMLDWF